MFIFHNDNKKQNNQDVIDVIDIAHTIYFTTNKKKSKGNYLQQFYIWRDIAIVTIGYKT